jgi:hypothetical protein
MSSTNELRRLINVLGLSKNEVMLEGQPEGRMEFGGEFDISPEQFLAQAQADFEAGGTIRRLNSLTNSKRAIQAQVDRLILAVGLEPKGIKTKEKWALLRDIGFIAPRILHRTNDARNRLEHEYTPPTDGEVEDALDLAMLFMESGGRGIASFSLGKRCEYREGDYDFPFRNELSFAFGLRGKGFVVWAFKDTPDAPFGHVHNRPDYNVGEIEVVPVDPVYVDLVRIGVAVDRGNADRIEQAVSNLFDSLQGTAAP